MSIPVGLDPLCQSGGRGGPDPTRSGRSKLFVERRSVRAFPGPLAPPVTKHAVKGRLSVKQQRGVEPRERCVTLRRRGCSVLRICKGLQPSWPGGAAAAGCGGRVILREKPIFVEEGVRP